METIGCIFLILMTLIGLGKVRDANARRDQERRAEEDRNNPCNYEGDGRGMQNNASYKRIPSGPVRR